MTEKRKVFVPTLIAVLTLLLLVVGATYAYFSVDTTNTFGTKTITTSAESIGNVALSAGNNLRVSLTAEQMMNKGLDTVYYASNSGTTTTPTSEVIGTATVTGEGIYKCTYSLSIDDNSNSMYDVFQGMNTKSAGQIILTVNGTKYDFNTTDLFPKVINGSMIVSSEEEFDITASLKIINSTTIDQSGLKGTNITLTMSLSDFNCDAVESILPKEYQQIEYIQSDGTQYLNTGVMPTNLTGVELTIQDYTETDDYDNLFGVKSGDLFFDLNKRYLNYRDITNRSHGVLFQNNTIKLNKGELFVDGVKKISIDNSTNFNINKSIYLFARNVSGGSVIRYASFKLLNCKIYENDEIIRNYIPAYRISDDAVGLYDIINNQFYVSGGAGAFIKGNDI